VQGADRDITRCYIFRLCTLNEGPWNLRGDFWNVFVLPTARADRLSLFLGTQRCVATTTGAMGTASSEPNKERSYPHHGSCKLPLNYLKSMNSPRSSLRHVYNNSAQWMTRQGTTMTSPYNGYRLQTLRIGLQARSAR
jgi:hypothetical protein